MVLVNRIEKSIQNQTFRGYQHKINDCGASVMHFNFVHDYTKEKAQLEIYKVKKNNEVYAGYEIITDSVLAKFDLTPKGVEVNLDDIDDLDRDEAFAYRFVVNGHPVTDTGIDINGYNLVTRKGTRPTVQGAGYLSFPDSQRVGVKYRNFEEDNTGEIYIDKTEQREMEKVVRTFSNKTGGNLAGLEYNLDYLAQNGYKIQMANPIAGGDNKSSHRYWNKNNFQISDDMGNVENFNSYIRKLYQKGMLYVYDGTFTSEGLEGIHFQYALRWANQKPQSYYWFKMQGIKDQALGLGVVPNHKENLRHVVINSPVIFNEKTGKIEENRNYRADRETYFQIYDASLVEEEQLQNLEKPFERYENVVKENNSLINSHDNTIVNYAFEINPSEYVARLRALLEFNRNNEQKIELNSPEGTLFIGQFSNFKVTRKTEGGFVAWDANTDIAKLNYQTSGYDEKIDLALTNPSERDYEHMMRERGAYEVQDMALQAGRYWTKKVNDEQILYTAQVIKNSTSEEELKRLIDNGLLPKEAYLEPEAVNNVLQGFYKLAPKGVMNKDDVTVRAIMQLPLDSLEFAENTVGVLSTSYFSNRAINEDTLGKTRFELLKAENPHLTEPYAENYMRMNLLLSTEIKNFVDEIIKEADKNSLEKLLNENDDYTEYGEYVVELIAPSIAKYALLKSLTGKDLKTKILPNGEITYDYVDIKERTSLKSLGIQATNPQEEAELLLKMMETGLSKLDSSDVKYLSDAVSRRIEGTRIESFRLAEAMVKKSGLGLSWRLDAAKDVMDQDADRNGDAAFDDIWKNLIAFWQKFVEVIKSENPNSYIVAEITDVDQLMRDNLGEKTSCFDKMPNIDSEFKSVPDLMLKFFNETGITSEAAYSYFFTDVLKVFGQDFSDGSVYGNTEYRCTKFVKNLQDLIKIRGIDYIKNLFTFVGNHDKPRIIHGLALDMGLFHGNLGVFDEEGNANYELNRNIRKESLLQLTNSDNFDSLPLEAKLNIDNPNYFKTVSTYAVAMSQLLRNSINDSLKSSEYQEEIEYLKSALVDLTNGNYLGNGQNVQIPSIKIPVLSSLENSLNEILRIANLDISSDEYYRILSRANESDLIKQYYIQGDFDWAGNNAHIGERNQNLAETILRGANEYNASGEWDYMKYSLYTVAIASILRQAFLEVKGYDSWAREKFLNAEKEFVKIYDRKEVESNQIQLPFVEDSKTSMVKNGYASRDIKTAIEMLVQQAEYIARKDGKLSEGEHFSNYEEIVSKLWQNSTEPAVQKATMMMTFLSAMVGLPTIYGGDELGMSGYDEKAKNVYLQCRNPLPWSELESGVFKEYREKVQKMMNEAMGLRSREGVDALNTGTAYAMSTSDASIPAFMMQDADGNMTVSVFNATGIDVGPRVNYFERLGINEYNKEQYFREHNIESINKDNPYVPIQASKEIEYIKLAHGLSLPEGLEFRNTDVRDKARYVVGRIMGTNEPAIFREKAKILLDGLTSKNGVMVLKHVKNAARKVPFLGNSGNINKQYNIVSNPYKIQDKTVLGENLSLLSV